MNDNYLLATLAYIQSNGNIIQVFSQYILYCLCNSDNKEIDLNSLQNLIKEEFKVKVPINIIKISLNMLKKNRSVEISKNVLKLINNNFDIDKFEDKRKEYQRIESELIENMHNFICNEYSIKMDIKELKKYFFNFILNIDSYLKFVLDYDVDLDKDFKYWYIIKYIEQLDKNSIIYEYLLSIVKCAIVFIVAYNNPTNNSIRIQGTKFFIDTKLILRYFGLSYLNEINAANELINIIKKNNGKVCVFNHTISEIENAIDKAYNSIKLNSYEYMDDELYIYYINNRDVDFSLLKEEIKGKIQKEFYIEDENVLYSPINDIHHIDIEKLEDFILSKKSNWKIGAIRNDVKTINLINILRRANYKELFGGKNRLPIFVTSNSALIYIISQYHKIDYEIEWKEMKLPIISDVMLSSLLYKEIDYDNIAENILLKDLYTIYDNSFFNKLKSTFIKINKYHDVNMINIMEVQYKKLEESLVKNTQFEEDNLNENIIIKTMDEIIHNENIDLSNKIINSNDTIKLLLSSKLKKDLFFYRILYNLFDKKIIYVIIFILSIYINNRIDNSIVNTLMTCIFELILLPILDIKLISKKLKSIFNSKLNTFINKYSNTSYVPEEVKEELIKKYKK